MKKLLKLANIGFYFLMLLVFFVLGLYFAGFIDAGKGQGLAGGAIVVGYGVLFSGIAFIASFFIAYFLETSMIKKLNWLLLVVLLATWGYTYYQFKQRDKIQEDKNEQFDPPPTSPTPIAEPVNEPTALLYDYETASPVEINNPAMNKSMGMGYFAPNYHENNTMYFFGNLNLEKSLMDHSPIDSMTFTRNKYNQFEIATAPPWLVPEIMKLDYDRLYFKIESVTEEFVEVVVNATNDQTSYVPRKAGNVIYWPEFLLSMHSVEFLPESKEVIRNRPFTASGVDNTKYQFMRPIKIKNEWMEVLLLNDGFKKVGKGWIQWQRNNKLLILYNLLS